MFDIRRLRMLHEFAARGSIARTAEALGYTPSAVSQQLAVLEKEAGTAPLHRTPPLARSLRQHQHLSLLLREADPAEGLQLVRSGEVEVAIVDDWTGRMSADLEAADAGHSMLSYYHLVRDPLILVVGRDHPAADPERPVDLRALRNESWLAAPASEPPPQGGGRAGR